MTNHGPKRSNKIKKTDPKPGKPDAGIALQGQVTLVEGNKGNEGNTVGNMIGNVIGKILPKSTGI